VSSQIHAPAAFSPAEGAPGTYWIEGWVGPRAGLDSVTKTLYTCRDGIPGPALRSIVSLLSEMRQLSINTGLFG
jgi:hypothetical protein